MTLEQRRRLVGGLAVVVLVGALVWIGRVVTSSPGESKAVVDTAAARECGRCLAQVTIEISALTGPLVVVTRPTDGSAVVLAQFRAGLTQRQPAAKIVIESLPAERDQPVTLTFAQFQQVLEKHPTAAAIIFLASAPGLTAEQIRQLPARRPPLITTAGLAQSYDVALAEAVLQAVVGAVVPGEPCGDLYRIARPNKL